MALLVVLVWGASTRAELDSGFRTTQVREVPQALRRLLPQANAGDTGAQYEIGVLYANGDGVPQDLKQAARWFRLAESRGHVQAKDATAFLEALGIREPPQEIVTESPQAAATSVGSGTAGAQVASPPAPFTSSSVPSGPYAMIQIATVATEAIAAREWRRLKKFHADQLGELSSSIEPFDAGEKGRFYRVLAGPLSLEAAKGVCVKVKEKGSTCMVLRRQ
ncbi:MAG: SPOR domain-containing protein [Alphaproteobacteria bacterium]